MPRGSLSAEQTDPRIGFTTQCLLLKPSCFLCLSCSQNTPNNFSILFFPRSADFKVIYRIRCSQDAALSFCCSFGAASLLQPRPCVLPSSQCAWSSRPGALCLSFFVFRHVLQDILQGWNVQTFPAPGTVTVSVFRQGWGCCPCSAMSAALGPLPCGFSERKPHLWIFSIL